MAVCSVGFQSLCFIYRPIFIIFTYGWAGSASGDKVALRNPATSTTLTVAGNWVGSVDNDDQDD
ncbi:MAG TPA: hypothetical protein DCY06_03050 [Bacteroidetes bacterium]|nr:hypothetical protein [Bacteroidota bacterium]